MERNSLVLGIKSAARARMNVADYWRVGRATHGWLVAIEV